jgi:hypothetical protein
MNRSVMEWLFGPESAGEGQTTHLLPRWIFLRALGLIYFSAFYSLLFQIKGLIGRQGLLPASDYLTQVAQYFPGIRHFWFAPTLLWLSPSDRMLMLLCWAGLLAAVALVLNWWPRAALVVCFVCFLSFVAAAQDFSGYQSDGMLLEAGFISIFFAPPGLRPKLAASHAPSRAACFLLLWEWFRIYFGSGVVKLASGDYSWRHFTAMDDYYQNGPLPTWVGWYVQHLPHKVHAFATLLTLVMELGIVFMMFLPRRWRIACFLLVTPFQAMIIFTANYTFLNYLVLSLGVLLLDDAAIRCWLPRRWNKREQSAPAVAPISRPRLVRNFNLSLTAVCLFWIFYATSAQLFATIPHFIRLPQMPVAALEPFRIANSYGLFAVMTHARYEIEFQGSNDGQNWIAYPFRYKPQDVSRPPGIYAPYQPRFDWNLWFASLGSWRENPFVLRSEEQLLRNSPDVLRLFAGNPFAGGPPQRVRAMLWQYWFTDLATKRREGVWWRRELLGPYAPGLQRLPDGTIVPTDLAQNSQ